jgi:IS5 family transposase
MRVVKAEQMTVGEVDIADIVFDKKSRDDIPKVLRGLQHLYLNKPLREALFALLEAELLPKIDKALGRPGMPLWNIFVCAVLRLDLNADYDRLHELVNQHVTLRQMLGHGPFNEHQYSYQSLVDNLRLFTPELLDKINTLVVQEGHVLVKKAGAALRGRCDSFVVETNVHYPTDITLLLDALRKILTLIGRWCEEAGLSDFRQYRHNIKAFKRLVRTAQMKKRCKVKEAEGASLDSVQQAHQTLLESARKQLDKVGHTLPLLQQVRLDARCLEEIQDFIAHAERQIEQIERRVIHGEVIPHAEKVFSLFQPHTEWISKGKAGVPVELGVRVGVVEDQYRFILHHRVMAGETDDKAAVAIVRDAQHKFPDLRACSFDKGFHSPANQQELAEQLDQVVLPRKGKLSQERQAIEYSAAFKQARRHHAAVESAINALEVHGLDLCPDHGIAGFKRYVALAVVTRNIHRIGDILWQQAQAREKRQRAAKQGWQNKAAA